MENIMETERTESEWELEFAYYHAIAEENGFSTVWSASDGIIDMDELSPYEGKYLKSFVYGLHDYETNTTIAELKLTLPNRRLTWLELWFYADIYYSFVLGHGNSHLYIESFEVEGDTIEVGFGS
jgi:hypothetical protein